MVFMTDGPSYCYQEIPFGIKNVGAIYQRLMDKVFQVQIGRKVEVYVDDMVAKTPSSGDLCADVEEIFMQLRKNNMRLKPCQTLTSW